MLVQLPEPLDNPAFATIADAGKERIRRAINAIKPVTPDPLPHLIQEPPNDLGFRVFKLAASHLRQWQGMRTGDGSAYVQALVDFASPLEAGTKTRNAIWEVALREGFSLTSQIERVSGIASQTVYRVSDPDMGQSFTICLDDMLRIDALWPLRLTVDDLFVCRDSALDDTSVANLALQCRLKTI
jgi:adenine-specific DNA-methyltransferase